VHAANHADTKEGCVLAKAMAEKLPRLEAFCVDEGYRGTFVETIQQSLGKVVHISKKIKDQFAVIPKRWVVERTFSWLGGHRRLSKDYEKTTSSSEAFIWINAISRNLKSCALYVTLHVISGNWSQIEGGGSAKHSGIKAGV
jgi:putative transposase